MSEEKWGIGVVIALFLSSIICSVGTISWMNNNLSGSADGPLIPLTFGLIFLTGAAGLIAGIFVGRNIVIRTNPSIWYKVLIYILFPILGIVLFYGATYFLADYLILILF